MANIRIAYVWDEILMNECDRLPAVKNRASMVHQLIKSYELLESLKVVPSKPATYDELKEFHSSMYLDHIKQMPQTLDEDYEISEADEELGLAYDCEPIPNLYKLIEVIAGGTLSAAETLISGSADVAINWCGGWHHAQRFEAEGFCYVNDIVVAIEKLRKTFPKVLYVDLDIHHGNGVENAYNIAKSVFTLSLHKHEAGFYPGSGGVHYVGSTMVWVTLATSLSSMESPMHHCVMCFPGGYNFANVARTWTLLTGRILQKQLDDEIPDNEYFLEYSPGYNLTVSPGSKPDKNDKDHLDKCLEIVTGNLKKYLGKNLENLER